MLSAGDKSPPELSERVLTFVKSSVVSLSLDDDGFDGVGSKNAGNDRYLSSADIGRTKISRQRA